MNIFDEDDRRIEAILKADIYEPDSYKRAIMTALDKNHNRKIFNLPKLIAGFIAGAMLISGIVYAKQIEEFILSFFNNSKAIDSAIENGYIDSPNIEFNTIADTKVQLEHIIMDDNNLSFILDIRFNEDLNVRELMKLTLLDLIVTDDSNNILYCGSKQRFDEYCNNKNLNYDYLSFNDKYIDSNCNWYIKSVHKESNSIKVSYSLNSISAYPKSQKLFIEFSQIELIMSNNVDTIYMGNCNTEVTLIDKFSNRELQSYHVSECNEPLIIINCFNVYNTGSVLEFEAEFKPFITDDMPEELKLQKEKEFKNWGRNLEHGLVDNSYMENSNGEKFYQVRSNSDDSIMIYEYNGNFKYKNYFDLTQYDATDTLTVYFTIHTIDGSEDVVIKLERDK